MAPRKISTKNLKAATTTSAEKQEERVLQVLNKHLLGEFNPEDWNPKHKMNWGGHMVE